MENYKHYDFRIGTTRITCIYQDLGGSGYRFRFFRNMSVNPAFPIIDYNLKLPSPPPLYTGFFEDQFLTRLIYF